MNQRPGLSPACLRAVLVLSGCMYLLAGIAYLVWW